MIDKETQQNLLLFNEALTAMKDEAGQAWERAYGFSGIYNSLYVLRPYVDNLALFCNEYWGTDIAVGVCEDKDLISQAESCKHLITEVGQVINSRLQHGNGGAFDIYSDASLAVLGKRLQTINQLPAEQAFLNRYFMKGALAAWEAVAAHRRRDCTQGFPVALEDSEITDKIMEQFALNGVILSDEDKKSLNNALCAGCDQLVHGKVLTPEIVSSTIVQSIGESLELEKQTVQTVIGSQQNTLFNMLKQEKRKMRRNQAARRELLLFAQNIAPISHKDAENMVYLSRFKENVPLNYPVWDSAHELPSYLQPYHHDVRFKNVMQQMKFWENYENKAADFDKEVIYEHLGKINKRRLGCVYADLNFYEDELDAWLAANDNNDDDEYPDSPQRQDLLEFAISLEEATRHSAKYSGLVLNDTGVGEETLKKLKTQKMWCLQDVNLLGEFFDDIGYQLDENLAHIQAEEDIDYDAAVELVLAMPHGRERYDALCCLYGTFEAANAGMDEDMDMILEEIDGLAGYRCPAANAVVSGLLEDSVNMFSDLRDENPEELFHQIRIGVLSAYVIPLYQKIDVDENEQQETVAAFVENYDAYTPEARKFILGISEYYAKKVMPFHRKAIAQNDFPETLKESLAEYGEVFSGQCYLDRLTDGIAEAKQEEYRLLVDYQKYKSQKAMYELPDNFDVMLAAKFYGGRKSR